MKIRIALDQSIGRRRAIDLVNLGYHVVVVAKPSETDESWVNRAFSEGAQFAISPDLDIPRLIENRKYPMVWINYPSDQDEFRNDLVKYVDSMVKFKLGVFRDMVADKTKKESKPWYSRFWPSTK